MYETHTTIVGTLITAVGKRRLADGTTVVSFRVASNERRFDRTTAAWTDGDTLYVSVTCWRRLGEAVHASLVVGDPIIVHGRIFSRSYEKDGRRQTVTEMEGWAVGPDLARSKAVVTRTKRTDAVDARPSADNDGDDPWESGRREPDGNDGDLATAGAAAIVSSRDSLAYESGAPVEAGVGV